MIINYKQYNESLLDKLVGPTDEEVWETIKDYSPVNLFNKSCELGIFKGIKLAMERGVNIFSHFEFYDSDGRYHHYEETSGLEFLIRNDEYEMFKYTFDNYELNENSYDIQDLNIILSICIELGKINFTELCIKKGGNINDDNFDMLKSVISRRNFEMVKFLLENGADINVNYKLRMKVAERNNSQEIINILKEYKIKTIKKFKFVNLFKESLLGKLTGPTEEEVWETIKDYSLVNLYNRSCEMGYFKGIKYAVERGVNIFSHFEFYDDDDYMYDDETSGLEYLIKNDEYDIFKYILDSYKLRTDPNDYDYFMMLLEVASFHGKLDFVKLCIEIGGDINDENYTILENVILKQNYEMVEFLLKKGANVNMKYSNCMGTALKLGNEKIINILKKYS